MIHPPPEVFEQTVELAQRRRLELRRASEPSGLLIGAFVAVVVLGLHVAIFLVLTRREAIPPAPPQMPAAVMITLAPVAVTARSDVDNLKNAPPADATAPAEMTPPVDSPPPPPAAEPIVQAPPPPPDVIPPAPLPPKPPEKKIEDEKRKEELEKERLRKIEKEKLRKKLEKEKIEKEKERKREREREQRASQAGGGPRSNRQTADVTAAAAAGSTVSETSKATWLNEVRAKIVRAKRFPMEAHGQTGVSVVSVTFGASGGVSGVRLIRSSGNAALDAEAEAVMSRAAPYPPPPGGKATTLAVPLNFRR